MIRNQAKRYNFRSHNTAEQSISKRLNRFSIGVACFGWITVNPAELLEPMRTEDSEIKIIAVEEKKKLLEVISQTFPKKAAMVRAFVPVQRFSALRMSDMVSLEVAALHEGGVLVKTRLKTDEPVYCPLPPVAMEALKTFTPKSDRYLFWTGSGELETATKDWSATLNRRTATGSKRPVMA
jgi:site-specific recombinase XerD